MAKATARTRTKAQARTRGGKSPTVNYVAILRGGKVAHRVAFPLPVDPRIEWVDDFNRDYGGCGLKAVLSPPKKGGAA